MNNKQRLLAGALLLGGGVVLGTLAVNMAENSTSNAQQKQMSPAVQGKVLQPSEPIAIPDKEDVLAPIEIKELPNGGAPSVVNTAAEQIAKKAEVDRLSRHYQEAEQKAQDAQRAAQQLQLQQALSGQNKSLLTPAQQADAEKLRQAESQAKADAEKKRLAEEVEAKRKTELAQAEAKRKAELASTEAEKKRQAELQAKSEAEKKRLAEQAEAKRKAEVDKKRQEQLKAEADKKRQAEAEKKRLAEQAEAKRKAEAEKKRLAEQAEAKKKAELEKKRKAEQAKKDTKSSPKDHALWMVQIALADKENATAMAGKLRSKGYRVTLSPTSKGVRVLVGPHKDRAAADSVRQRIAGDGSLNMRSAWVHSWVPLEYRK